MSQASGTGSSTGNSTSVGASSSQAPGQLPGQLPVKKHSELGSMIELMARMLVDLPDQVEINEIAGENTTVIELKVAKEDLGKIIGKQGRTARALRTVLNGASTKLRKRTVLEIIE